MDEQKEPFILPEINNEFIPIENDLFNTAYRKKIVAPVEELRFLDFKQIDFGNQTNIGLVLDKEVVHVESFQIKAGTTKKQVDSLGEFGIDHQAMLKSTLLNESTISTTKSLINLYDNLGKDHVQSNLTKRQLFLQKWINLSFPTYVTDGIDIARKIMLYSNLIAASCRRGAGNFVIVSSKIHSLLCDSPAYLSNQMDKLVVSNGSVYLNGTIGSIKVFVDPYATADHLIIGRSLNNLNDPEPGVVFLEYVRKFDTGEMTNGDIVQTLLSRHAIKAIGKVESARANYYTADLVFKKRPYWRKLLNV